MPDPANGSNTKPFGSLNSATNEVHRAFDERDSEGFAALQAAMHDSGIIPPDLDDFEWNSHMGPDEADDPILSALRHWLQRANALRKRHNKLRRTQAGAKMTQDATLAWQRLTQHLFPSGWDGFAVENAALVMLCSGGEIADKELDAQVAERAAECGWHAWHDGEQVAPSAHAVSWAFGETLRLWNACGFLVSTGDWADRQHSLTEAGTAAILTRLRHTAAGPSNRPF